MQVFKSHGKLLLTGEYVVLDGASALALPTKYSQTLKAERVEESAIFWKSFNRNAEKWLEAQLSLEDLRKSKSSGKTEDPKARLFSLLQTIHELNPEAFKENQGWKIETYADFPLDWGLGSSSTLIANLSRTLSVDAFELLKRSFGGSGYDVAVALEGQALIYQLHREERSFFSASFDPPFKDKLHFVYLNQKQNSRKAISHYRKQDKTQVENAVEKISSLTHQILVCENLSEFEILLEIHENIISQLIDLPKVKSRLFPDFPGQIKSLGGWGGDFVLATGEASEMDYFRRKGYTDIIPYAEMILE